ncbi:MAG: mechanosensitive ion channel [Halioglobus sp.]|nr:mechanosensitive ion channel [Halioglobus sp.]
MFRVCRLIGLILLLVAAASGAAQEPQAAGPPATAESGTNTAALGGVNAERIDALQQQLARLEEGVVEVTALDARIEGAPELDREALRFRRDERSFQLLERLDELALAVGELPTDEPFRRQITQLLENEYASLGDVIFARTLDITERIAKFSEEAESLEGAQKIALQAYVYGLKALRLKSYQGAARLIESRRALGLAADDLAETLRSELLLRAETLAGRLEFHGAALTEMQARLKDNDSNADLADAARRFASSHAEDVDRLKTIVGIMDSLDVDSSAYKSILLQQGNDFSVKDFERDVFVEVLRNGWRSLRQWLSANGPDVLFNLVIFVLVLLVFRFLSRLARRAVVLACDRSGAQMSTLLKDVLASVSGGAVMVMGLLMALSQIGISLGPMLAGLGVAGFIVGFALQDTLGNFAAGGMILLYRPYDVDDYIEVTGASGLVKKMSLVSTTITTFDNQTLVVPNSKIWGDVIKNVTAQKVRRVDMQFGISYSDDIAQAERVLQDIVAAHEAVLKQPEPVIRLHSLGDSSVNFIVRPWVRTADYWSAYWDITREVKVRFDEEGITIPFPQREVHYVQEKA